MALNRSSIPKVSIIIPIYNVEKYLQQCIDSCINQNLKEIEIILINDGSTDSSIAICNHNAQRDSRIVIVHQSNKGLSGARNAGIEIARSEYLLFLDADDWIDATTCEEVYNSAINHNADVIFWSTIKEYQDRRSLNVPILNKDFIFVGEDLKWLQRRLIGLTGKELLYPTKTDAFNSAWGKLYRRSLLMSKSIRFVDTKEIGSEDVLFNIQFFFTVQKVIYLHQFYNHYRQDNPNAITKSHNLTLFPRFLNLFNHINLFITLNNLSEDHKLALNNRIALSVINCVLSISSKNNIANYSAKIRAINFILKNKVYKSALRALELKHLPIYWKIFFFLCKCQFAIGVYQITFIMRLLKKIEFTVKYNMLLR
jgi:glycosyltransferase EpsH